MTVDHCHGSTVLERHGALHMDVGETYKKAMLSQRRPRDATTKVNKPKITWLSVDSIQSDVMDVGVERAFSPQNFSMLPWE